MSGRPPARGLLLDLDGTLLDTGPDMGGALNRLLVEEGRRALPYPLIRPHVSHGAAALVRLGFGSPEPSEFERLRQRFLALYATDVASDTTLFPGFADVLQAVESRGLRWGIVTNKPTGLTEALLAALDLRHRAATVVCGDTFPERKPHPRPMLHAAAELGVEGSALLYVGDAERDIAAGRAAGMRTLAARYGYLGADEDPWAWQPDGVIDEPRELLPWLGL